MTEAGLAGEEELNILQERIGREIVRNLLMFTGSHRIARQKVPVDRILTRALASRKAHLSQADIRSRKRELCRR